MTNRLLALAGQALAAMVAIAYRRRAHGWRLRLLDGAGGGAAGVAGLIGIWDEMGYGALIEVLLVGYSISFKFTLAAEGSLL